MSEIIYEEITPSTRLISLATSQYGLNLEDIKKLHTNVVWGSPVTEQVTAALGYAIVKPTEKPIGDIVLETDPAMIDNQFIQQWTVLTKTPEQKQIHLSNLKSQLNIRINGLVSSALKKGVPYNFGSVSEPVIQHIQVRDGDRANHVGMSTKASRQPDIIQYFRTYENQQFSLTSEQLIAMTDAAYDGYIRILGVAWQIKDAIGSAVTEAELPEVPKSLEEFYTTNLQWTWNN